MLTKKNEQNPTLPSAHRKQSNEAFKADRYLPYIRDLLSRSNPSSEKTLQMCIESVSKRLGDKEPPNPRKVYRMARQYEQTGQITGPALRKDQRPTRTILNKQRNLAMDVINNEFKGSNGGNVSDAYRCFKARFAKSRIGGKPLSKTYFQRLVQTLAPNEAYRKAKKVTHERND